MFDLFQLLLLILIMFYFYFMLDQKLEKLNKELVNENKALNHKMSGLGQLISGYLKHNL